MELKIGSTIQSLRKQKNMTQEMLASALGVSAAAVSKWETDVTSPDISLLSPLARMLGTDVDEILNYPVELNDEEIESFTKKARVYYEQGQVQEGIDFCEAALREYPTDLRLKFQIASLYMTYATAVLDEEYAKGRLKRAIEPVSYTHLTLPTIA